MIRRWEGDAMCAHSMNKEQYGEATGGVVLEGAGDSWYSLKIIRADEKNTGII
jgi:hypothetical protein